MSSSSWFVRPETVRLDLGDADDRQWIEVKKRLTVGEERKSLARLVSEVRTDGRVTPNLEMLGKAEVMAYLIDWSLREDDGTPIRIDTDAKLGTALDRLSPEKFRFIATAVETHIESMAEERRLEKNAMAGAITSTSIS